MKLIIDIPDREYKQRIEFPLCYDSTIDKAIVNSTPLSEELEKIKAKINSEDVNCQYEEDYVYSSGLQKAIEIIDNHIAELKGENNG